MAIASVRTAEAAGGMEEAAALGLDRDALLRILHSLVLTRQARRARARALQAGQAARVVLHLQGQRGRLGRRRRCDGAGRPRRAAAPQPRPAPLPRRRAVARALPVHGPRRRHDQRARLQPAHAGRRVRASASSPAPRTCPRSCPSRSAPRSRSASAASRASRSAGSATARRRTDGARVDELRRRAAPADGLRDRQQPVRLLDADPPQLRQLVPGRPRAGLRVRGRRRRRHRRARGLPRGAAWRSSARARAAGRPSSS